MQTECIVVTSNVDGCKGVSVLDRTGSSLANNFKDCLVDTGAFCMVGGNSSFGGNGVCGDYLVAAQSKKPIINVYHWGKSQVHYQCHVQEITTSVAADPSGTYLLGGTKRGWMYCWELSSGKLLNSFQAHFKAITSLKCSSRGEFFISGGEDGMVRAWDIADMLNSSKGPAALESSMSHSVKPFKSWSPHTLAVKGLYLSESGSSIRVLTCSLDRAVVVHDLYTNKQLHRIALPQACESITCNATSDYAFVGCSNGDIFALDLSITAAVRSIPSAIIRTTGGGNKYADMHLTGSDRSNSTNTGSAGAAGSSGNYPRLLGHSRAVTSLSCSVDDCRLVSGSDDMCVRIWDMGSRQCLQEISVPRAITNVVVLPKSPLLQSTGTYRPSLAPFSHLKKYPEGANKGGAAAAESFAVLGPTITGTTMLRVQQGGVTCGDADGQRAFVDASVDMSDSNNATGAVREEAFVEEAEEDEEEEIASAAPVSEKGLKGKRKGNDKEEEKWEKVGKKKRKPDQLGNLAATGDFLAFGSDDVPRVDPTKAKSKSKKRR